MSCFVMVPPFRLSPFCSPRLRLVRQTGPCFARIARVRARVGAGAVRAPDCARESQGTPLLSVSQVVLNRRRCGGKRPPDAASFLPPYIATGFRDVKPFTELFQK